MHKERISWWWFLLIAGIIIPFIEYLLMDHIVYPGIFYEYFVQGLNPFAGQILYFLLILTIIVAFKLINRIKNLALSKLTTVLFSIVVLLLIFPLYIFEKHDVMNVGIRRYWTSFNTIYTSPQTIFHSVIFWGIVIAGVFLLFIAVNFKQTDYKTKEPSK